MKTVMVYRDADASSPVVSARVARSLWSRFWGLMGKARLPDGEGLLIVPCYSVHTMFMRFPIDVVFVDRGGRVMKVSEDLKPFRTSICRGSRSVLEMPGGWVAKSGLAVGDVLRFEPDI